MMLPRRPRLSPATLDEAAQERARSRGFAEEARR